MIIHKELLVKGNIISDIISEKQFQPAGVDISLKQAYKYLDSGKIDFDNIERRISAVEPIQFVNDEINLKQGAYKVMFNEYVHVPNDCAGFCFPRSSLLRSGITLECAVWDPGYEGRSEALLVVLNPHGAVLKRNAKIGQLVFIKLIGKTAHLYEGQYKGENK